MKINYEKNIYIFTKAGSSELYEDCLLVRKNVFIEEQEIDAALEIDDKEDDSIFFLYKDDEPKSTGRIRILDSGVKFERIATIKRYRGQGLGKKLMKSMQDYSLKNFENKELYMHSQESATSFYESIGWQKSGEEFYEADILHHKLFFKR